MLYLPDYATLPIADELYPLCRATAQNWDEWLYRCSRLLLCRLEHSSCRGIGAGRSVQDPMHRKHLAWITHSSSKG